MKVPPEIDGARVVRVADITNTTTSSRTRHDRDGEAQTAFERLAIAMYDDDSGAYLFYCGAAWNCLNDTCHDDVASAEAQARFEYEGVLFVDA